MVKLKRVYLAIYSISMCMMAYITHPWEAGGDILWKAVPVLIGMAVIMLILHHLNKYSERRGIGEARFESKTGKQLSND